jgi:hypothetical protein
MCTRLVFIFIKKLTLTKRQNRLDQTSGDKKEPNEFKGDHRI